MKRRESPASPRVRRRTIGANLKLPPNKASDLNTAAAWLLQQPIEEIPETIRGQAKLLREGLSQGSITRLIFAYAHNSYESTNVMNELQATRQLVHGLAISQQCDIEGVELGLRNIEALHLRSLGVIQIAKEIQFPADQYVREKGEGWEAFVISISGASLFDLYEEHKDALFSANLRDFLGTRRAARNVNNSIKATAESESSVFYIFNNGITFVCNKASIESETLTVHGISVVNGAQTTGAIHAAGREHAKNTSVIARIIVVDDHAMIPRIVSANNTQNAIVPWDRRSRDAVQIRLGQEFHAKDIEYVHRRSNVRKAANSLSADQVGQMLCAFAGNLQTAIRAKANIFEVDDIYNTVFPSSLGIGHVFGIQTLGWAYDIVKKELKAKVADGTATTLEQSQFRLLNYPASKQFLVRLMGDLREEISGRNMSDPQDFALKEEAITVGGSESIEAWMKVIRAVLPIIATELPAEDYQVIRSNEHTRKVAERAQGIIAGASVLEPSLQDLRDLLTTN